MRGVSLPAAARSHSASADVDLSASLGRDCRARLVASIPHYFVASSKLKESLPGDLGRTPLILRSADNSVRKEVDYFLRSNKIVPNIVAELDSPDLILAMVLGGRGRRSAGSLGDQRSYEQKTVVKLTAAPSASGRTSGSCAASSRAPARRCNRSWTR